MRRNAVPYLILASALLVGFRWATAYESAPHDAAQADAALPEVVDFNKHIRPIFTSHCTSCHGGVKQASGLSFVFRDTALDFIEPGSPDDSYILEKILEQDDDSRMPPKEHGRRLNEHEVALITRWIEQGAKWGKHWSYQLPQRHVAPSVSDPNWAKQPLDAFVLEQLDQRKIKPAPDERPERWLRRATLDLIGLPPTLAERKAFLNDLEERGEAAYEAVVDRLLESPRFGERWASVWFDQIRYADSRGQGEDSPRTIWKYRDWVIDALNADMPYDQFTIKQLAGDLLPDRQIEDHIATAVHRLTHTNEEGGTDDEEFRIAAIMDRVSTTWQTWQGTTFGCVQCHSHPYDPFEHDEYYKFAAYFNNTVDCDLSDDWPNLAVPLDRSDYAEMTRLTNEIDKLTRSLWQTSWNVASDEKLWKHLRISKAYTNSRVRLAIEPHDLWDEYHTVGTISSGTMIRVEMPLPENLSELTGIQITALPLDPQQALKDSEWGFIMSNIKAELLVPDEKPQKLELARVYGDEPFPRYDPNYSLNYANKEFGGREGFGAYTRIHHPRQAVVVLKSGKTIPPNSKLQLSILHRVTELAAFPLLTRRAHFAVSSDTALTELLDNEQLVSGQEQLKSLQAERKKIKSTTVPVLNEREDSLARPSHQFIRGNFLTKDKQVFPDVPNSLLEQDEPLGDRLSMAKWLVSADNPLTSRVAVNRYWARMFGVGLVATEEDFGSTGETPSHPELLDDLSVRFREDYGWSMKKLLREITLSHTYRQSSRIRPKILEADANNRWLARGPRHSLPAETIRDQMLAISGLLSTKMYGEPVHPPLPRGVWKARRGTWQTPKPGDEDRYRRSVYTYIKRSVPFPINAAFDAPTRDFCLPKRLRSNTPLQPLMLMNDVGFVECAQAFAQRMRDQEEQLQKQIEFGLLAATCRPPESEEVERLVKLYQEVEQESNAKIALQTVASVMLNLDEIITK